VLLSDGLGRICWQPAPLFSASGASTHQANIQDAIRKGLAMRKAATKTLSVSSGLMLLALVVGCKTIPTIVTDEVCLIWKPVTYSAAQDSEQTISEVRQMNAKREAYCN